MKGKTLTLTAVLLMLAGSLAHAAPDPAKCKATFDKFMELGNVPQLVAESYGYAVLPTIGKAGVGVGGAAGTGCVYTGSEQTGDVSMAQVTIGWQLGGQSYSQLILFQNKDVYKAFTRGQFEFGADATAVALTYGAQAGAGTKGASASAGDTKGKAAWKRGMAVYTLAKGGLMYEASIGGQKFNFKPKID